MRGGLTLAGRFGFIQAVNWPSPNFLNLRLALRQLRHTARLAAADHGGEEGATAGGPLTSKRRAARGLPPHAQAQAQAWAARVQVLPNVQKDIKEEDEIKKRVLAGSKNLCSSISAWFRRAALRE